MSDSEETVAQRMAASLGVGVERVRAAMEAAKVAFPLPTAADGPADPDGVRRPSPPPTSGFARTPGEALCGEEEALAAGSFGDPPDEAGPLPAQLRAWSLRVRGVARSRQKAYYEALLLAQMQFTAWQKAFPAAFALAAKERGWEPIGGREEEVLAMFSAGFARFLNETLRIARDGG